MSAGPLLVVVDMQEVFADPASGWAAPGFAGILPAVRGLLDRFGPDAVLTRFVAPQEPRGAWRDYYRAWPWALQPEGSPMWDLVPELAGTGLPVLDAPTFGKWERLRARADGADRLVVCGVSTECCVLATVLAAADAGLAVDVVTDACAGASTADHDRAIAVMATFAPLVRLTDAVGAAT